MTISGPGAEDLTVERSTAPATPEFRIFDISYPRINVTISGLTITNGSAPSNAPYGGGIYSSGNLTLKNSTVTFNIAEMEGGGIYSEGGLHSGGQHHQRQYRLRIWRRHFDLRREINCRIRNG